MAGTHGKSTVTALIGTLLDAAHRNNSLICGAELLPETADDAVGGISGWRHLPQPGAVEYFVVESCEYRRHFLEIAVQTGVILNIEPDHFDCFPSFAERKFCRAGSEDYRMNIFDALALGMMAFQ